MSKWRDEVISALHGRRPTCCQCDDRTSSSCLDRIAQRLPSSRPISIRELIIGAVSVQSGTLSRFLICKIGFEPRYGCPTIFDDSGVVLAALTSTDLSLYDQWLVISIWNFFVIGNKFYLEIDCQSAWPLFCESKSRPASLRPDAVSLSECESLLSGNSHVSVRFKVSAISAAFPGDQLFIVDVTCVKNPASACFIVFAKEHIHFHPFIRVGCSYIASFLRLKIIQDAKQVTRPVLLLTSLSAIHLISELRFDLKLCNSQSQLVPHSVVNYEGVITGQLMDGVFQLDHNINVYFTHARLHWLRAGIGLRKGVHLRLFNVHVVYTGPDMIDLALCTYSSVEFVKLSASMDSCLPWENPAIAYWCNRLNLPHTILLCRTLMTLKKKFRRRISSSQLLQGSESCQCLDLLFDETCALSFKRSIYCEFLDHEHCSLVPHPSLILYRPLRSVRKIAELVDYYQADMVSVGPDRVFMSSGQEILAAMFSADSTFGTLMVSDDKQFSVRCFMDGLQLHDLRRPFVSKDFAIVNDSAELTYIELSLESCQFVGQNSPSPARADRLNVRGRVLQVIPAAVKASVVASSQSFSALVELTNRASALFVFKGDASALESTISINCFYNFRNIVPSSADSCPTFILDNFSEIDLLSYEDSEFDSIDNIVSLDLSTDPVHSIISISGIVMAKNVVSVPGSERHQIKLHLTLRSEYSPHTVDAFLPLDRRRMPLGILVGRKIHLHRIARCVVSSGSLCLFGSAETVVRVPAQPLIMPLPTCSSSVPLSTLSSLKGSCTARISGMVRRVHVRLISVVSMTLHWSCPCCNSCVLSPFDRCLSTGGRVTARLTCKLTAMVDDGTAEASLSCSKNQHSMPLLPANMIEYLPRLRHLADKTGVFYYERGKTLPPECLTIEQILNESLQRTATFRVLAKARMPGRFIENDKFEISAKPKETSVAFGKTSLVTSSLPRLILSPVLIERVSAKEELNQLLSKLSQETLNP